jgi:hypothetical protein
MGRFDWPITQKNSKPWAQPPHPPPIPPLHCKLHVLTQCNMDFHNLIFKHLMLYIYMDAHGPYTLIQIVNKFHYDINIYTKCMSS